MRHPLLDALRAPLHIAHRGGAALYPENTVLAFTRAVHEHGADGIELDVHLTADGAVVVCHDPDLDRCTDAEGPVSALTLSTLKLIDAGYRFTPDGGQTFPFRGQGCRIPTLVEVLHAVPDRLVNLEVKTDDPAAVPATLAVLRAADALGRTIIGSELDTVGEALHAAAPDACHYFPRDALTAYVMAALTRAPTPHDDRWAVLDMPATYNGMPLITPGLLGRARVEGRWINVWTIDDAEEMRALLTAGVGGVMTDRPDRLRAVLAEFADRP